MTEQQKEIVKLIKFGLTWKKVRDTLQLGEDWHEVIRETWHKARIEYHIAQRGVKKRRGVKYP